MRSKKLSLLVLGAAIGAVLAGTLLLKDTLAQNAAPAPASRVAVCDIVQVFNNYNRAKDLQVEFEKRMDQTKAENEKRIKAIEAIQMELEGFKAGTKDYEDRYNKIQRLTIDRKAWLQYEEMLGRNEQLRLTQEMYKDAMDTIGQVAKDRAIDIVLYREMRDVPTADISELLSQIERRKVLYNTAGADITEEVLARMNRAYRGGK